MVPMTVLGYIESDLQADGIELVNPDLRHFLMAARRLSHEGWEGELCPRAGASDGREG